MQVYLVTFDTDICIRKFSSNLDLEVKISWTDKNYLQTLSHSELKGHKKYKYSQINVRVDWTITTSETDFNNNSHKVSHVLTH